MLLLAGAALLRASTCGPSAWAPVCEVFPQTPAIFSGTVISERTGRAGRLYLASVDEAFRGLPGNTREVIVYPEGFGTEFTPGVAYLFRATPLPRPDTWPGRGQLPVFASGACSGTDRIENSADDIEWLRDRAKGLPETRVFGSVVQNFKPSLPLLVQQTVPLAAAQVTLRGARGTYRALSAADGRYALRGVPPGEYELEKERQPWWPLPGARVKIDPGGCAMRSLGLRSNGMVRGRVLDHRGAPAGGVRVGLLPRLPEARLLTWSESRPDGSFEFRDVPAATFEVGVNLTEAPSAARPFRRTAVTVRLGPHDERSGIAIRLTPPIPKRPVRVRVRQADGSPVPGTVKVFAKLGGLAAGDGSSESGVVELALLQGFEYWISAQWYKGDRTLNVNSAAVRLPVGSAAAELELRLP
jgi:hypothetical protein